jgi:hypothetical protein
MPVPMCMIVARLVIRPMGMFGVILVRVPRRMIMRVFVVRVVMLLPMARLTPMLMGMVVPVMIVLFHSAHLTSLAQESA